MTETLFSADLHLRHKFMAELRGWTRETVEEHDDWLIDAWNTTVDRRDTVWFLGDFTFARKAESPKLFAALNGSKHLIVGNHDPAHVRNLPWASVSDLKQISVGGQSLVLCHYPLLTWQNAHYGAWHLHGHSHGNLRVSESTRLDVGIDCHPQRRPFCMDEIVEIMQARSYDGIDHHGE